jgi:hypothetical protein
MAKTSWLFVVFDTAGEVIFAEENQSANQLIKRAPSMGSGLFQTSPAVSLLILLAKSFEAWYQPSAS